MPITIGTNIASLQAQRQLTKSTDSLTSIYERLSSGMRINHASDDAAGLAIATSLNSDSKIYTQAIRNLNDGLSVLSIAEGAVSQLTDIVTRQTELAEQAANGSYTATQRSAMQTEVTALNSEFNRIIGSTTFNGINLLTDPNRTVTLQAGYGANSQININVGTQMARTVGDGTFGAGVTITGFTVVQLADFNGDGLTDFLSEGGASYVSISNGDGTFKIVDPHIQWSGASAADYNGDGKLDVLSGYRDVKGLAYGNGDGTFLAPVTFAIPNAQYFNTISADFNGDGRLDFIDYDQFNGVVLTALQNGNGTFSLNFTTAQITPYGAADINGDNKQDILYIGAAGPSVAFGNGNGTFQFSAPILPNTYGAVYFADINNDGRQDIVKSNTSAGGDLLVFLGNSNGSFSAAITTLGTTPANGGYRENQQIVDINGDGNLDFLYLQTTGASYLLGNGNGTFRAGISITSFNGADISIHRASVVAADFTGDGIKDILIDHGGLYNELLSGSGNPVLVTTQESINVSTQTAAKSALTTLSGWLTRLGQEQGSIGAYESRLQIATNTLRSSRENYKAAESRILDADIAFESANLLRTQILQQASSAILAQANQAPALALQLLKF